MIVRQIPVRTFDLARLSIQLPADRLRSVDRSLLLFSSAMSLSPTTVINAGCYGRALSPRGTQSIDCSMLCEHHVKV
jgi:hypothetical protein